MSWRRAAVLASACWVSDGVPPSEPFYVVAPMAESTAESLKLTVWQTAFTTEKLDKVPDPEGLPGVKVKDSHGHVNGHLVYVDNPKGRFSVVAPLDEDEAKSGCGNVAFVKDTSRLHSPRCILATDAGYYSLHEETKFDCIGNVVGDGVIHNTGPFNETNVNFGVLANGSWVIGYISPEMVKSNMFSQLVQGLGWIVHEGKSYVDEGWEEAYTAAGSSGDEYKSMTSGRTAVGWTAEGKLIILQYDGHTHEPSWGVTMTELADKLIEFGAVEAVNLDGGGSTQMWYRGEQIGYSSDRGAYGIIADTYDPDCPIGIGKGNLSAFECTRKVSTILCIHEDHPEPSSSAVPWAFIFLAVGILGGAAGGYFMGKKKGKKGTKRPLKETEDSSGSE